MKYFTLSYSLAKDDYKEYDSIYLKDLMKINLKRLPIYLIPVVICTFIAIDVAFFFLIISALSIMLPLVINMQYSKERNASFIFKRDMTVDFYADHIVTRLLPDESFNSTTETHYGFDKVSKILESDSFFYFIFFDNTVLLIPKRVLGEKEYEMIKNLIDNLFRNKYLFIMTKN